MGIGKVGKREGHGVMSDNDGRRGLTGTLIEGSIALKHRNLQTGGFFGNDAPRPAYDGAYGFTGQKMSIEIDVLNGDASWPRAKPLLDAVWPPERRGKTAMAARQMGPCRSARADRCAGTREGGLACHVGIYFRTAHLERAQGPHRRYRRGCDPRGLPRPGLCQPRARRRDPDHAPPRSGAICAACSASRTISRSTRRAAGIPSPARSMPSSRRDGSVSRRWRRSCSISAARRARASSTYAACRGDPCVARGGLRRRRPIIC